MNLSSLTAISPIDGRYRSRTADLANYFSEFGLIKYRVIVEAEYLLFLSRQGFFTFPAKAEKSLLRLVKNFSPSDADAIKATEKVTNHDVKAVEYFLKNHLRESGQTHVLEWVHFGLTSQDINNTAIPMMWRDALQTQYLPSLQHVMDSIISAAKRWKNIPMLARTHGQPASPTMLGKELMVFADRLKAQQKMLSAIPHTGKFGGATGNFNAHHVAFPDVKWDRLADQFLKEHLGLRRQQVTTQIEHYDMLAAFFDVLARINTILIDFCRDLWTYISIEYFHQKTKADEVGSSAMPHKVNPIDFENAEGNLGMANALFSHLSAKLPVSRLQRDLTDSTVLRNIGVPVAHTIIALDSIRKGIMKLELNAGKVQGDLDGNWAVIAEAIQTILRRENFPEPYEALKALTRGKKQIDRSTIHSFIDSLDISESVRQELKSITPENYTGIQSTSIYKI